MSEKYVTLPNLISEVFYTEKTSESDFDCDFVFQNPDLQYLQVCYRGSIVQGCWVVVFF